MKKIIIAGGGTGGHIFPAIAIANALTAQNSRIQILFVGAKGKMEMEKIPQAGYKIEGINMAGLNRTSFIKNIALPWKLIKSFFQVRKIFQNFQPQAVVGVGGYSTFPVLRYAQAKGVPTFIHESNSFAGKANIMLAKKAAQVFVAAVGMEHFFPADKILITGNPVRQSIVQANVTKETALAFFKLNTASTTVLVLGGSLGASSINKVIAANLSVFQQNNLQLIWQTGNVEADAYKALSEPYKNIWCNQFINQMEYAYAAADVVISRAGAMAVTELCVVGKPVIFVPYPFAAEDHQTANAKSLVAKQAAILVADAEVEQKLFSTLLELTQNSQLQNWLKMNIAAMAVTNADEIIASEILKKIA
jgi:UDP-N-acetylglucosamine--N-acetylmuramyl-(pentapeptide) pyrophosphoryl-undecaprenol N-acetylglucosamine transferase